MCIYFFSKAGASIFPAVFAADFCRVCGAELRECACSTPNIGNTIIQAIQKASVEGFCGLCGFQLDECYCKYITSFSSISAYDIAHQGSSYMGGARQPSNFNHFRGPTNTPSTSFKIGFQEAVESYIDVRFFEELSSKEPPEDNSGYEGDSEGRDSEDAAKNEGEKRPPPAGISIDRVSQNPGSPQPAGIIIDRVSQNPGSPQPAGIIIDRVSQNPGSPRRGGSSWRTAY